MSAVITAPLIRREIGDDHVCVLIFDRPESGANIFDVATLDELGEHLDSVENDDSLRGLIIASAKKSIFVAGAARTPCRSIVRSPMEAQTPSPI